MEWTVRRRIAAGHLFSLLLLMFVAGAGMYALREMSRTYTATRQSSTASLQELFRGQLAAQGAVINQLRYLSDADDVHIQRRDSLLGLASSGFARLRDSAADASTHEFWNQTLRELQRWRRASDRAVDARAAGFFERAGQIQSVEAAPIYDSYEERLELGSAAVLARGEYALAAADAAAARWELLLIIAAAAAVLIYVIESSLLHRAITGPLGRTATALASDSAEILEVTVQQTWAAQQAAQAAARAARRFENTAGTQAQTLRHVERVSELANRAADSRNGDREEIVRKLSEEAARVAKLTRHRMVEIREIEEAVEEANEAARHSAARTREIETAARKVNAQGLQLLRLIAPRRDGKTH